MQFYAPGQSPLSPLLSPTISPVLGKQTKQCQESPVPPQPRAEDHGVCASANAAMHEVARHVSRRQRHQWHRPWSFGTRSRLCCCCHNWRRRRARGLRFARPIVWRQWFVVWGNGVRPRICSCGPSGMRLMGRSDSDGCAPSRSTPRCVVIYVMRRGKWVTRTPHPL